MKKIIIPLLLFSSLIFSQSGKRSYIYNFAASSGVNYHSETENWYERVVNAGGEVSSSELSVVDWLVQAIEDSSLRSKFYRLAVYLPGDLTSSLVPIYISDLTTDTLGNVADVNNNFVAGDCDEDGLGNIANSNKYLQTGFVPSDISRVSQYHFSFGYYSNYDTTVSAYEMGVSATSACYIISKHTDNNTYSRVFATSNVAVSVDSTIGLFHAQRDSSVPAGYVDVDFYFNGDSLAAGNITMRDKSSAEFYVGALNNGGSPIAYTPRKIILYYIAKDFTSAEMATWNLIVQEFISRRSANLTASIPVDYYDNKLIDFGAQIDTSEYQFDGMYVISPMYKDTSNGSDTLLLHRKHAPKFIRWDTYLPYDTLFVDYAVSNHSGGNINALLGLSRSYDGGRTWDSLEVGCIGGNAISLSSDGIVPVGGSLLKVEDTLYMFFATYLSTGDELSDFDYHATYLTKSGDLGETWTDTLRISDSTLHVYCEPSKIVVGDTINMIGFYYPNHDPASNFYNACLVKFNKVTNELTAFNIGNEGEGFNEASMIELPDGRWFAFVRANGVLPVGGWWTGISSDYGYSWNYTYLDTVTNRNKYPNNPTLFLMDDNTLIRWHSTTFYVCTDLNADSLEFSALRNSMFAYGNWLDYKRMKPLEGSETDTLSMLVKNSPNFYRLDENTIGYAIGLIDEPYSEPYFFRASRVPQGTLHERYETIYPGDYSGLNEWRLPFWGAGGYTIVPSWSSPPATLTGTGDGNEIFFEVGAETWLKSFTFRILR